MTTDATTAMTIDFLRARLLSERSVSRAAKERADQLARRVAELEEQLRAVTAQRRKAERAAVEVLAILDSQGFGRLSDATDESASDGEADDGGPGAAETGRCGGNARRDAPEDALSGSEMGGQAAAAAQAGGLSWKGRAAGHEGERRRPPPQQQKGRQLRQRQGHGHRRVHFYTRAADSSPKYHPGQSCRKIKRKELRSQTVSEEDVAGESAEEGQERSDCTVCTDERPDLDGEAGQDGQGSSSNGRVDDVGDCYMIDCGRDGEMERVLEKQAELIGQYEAEENAQREWEKKFRENRDSTADNVNLANKGNEMENDSCKRETAQITDEEVVCEQARSSEKNLFVSNKLSENQPKGVVAGACNNLEKSVPSPKGRFSSSLNAGHNKGQGDRNSDSDSSYNANARSSEHCKYMPSVESPSSDTPKSEISEWSSSCFHNHTDNQFDALLYQSTRNNDVEGVLEALQHAKMSLRKNLCRSSPPSQNLLALPAPEDRLREDDLPVNQMQISLIRSAPPSQEILSLQAPAYYLNRIAPDDTKVPVGHAGLFRVPTDSFPTNWMASSGGYGSRFSLTGTTQLNTSPSYAVNLMRSNSTSQYSSGYHPYSSMMPPVPTAGRRSMPEPDFRIWGSSFLPEIRRHWSDL